jgi:hypothetical protein
MRTRIDSLQRFLVASGVSRRRLLTGATLAAAAAALPRVTVEAGGRPRISASYALGTGLITVVGEGFAPDARITVQLDELDGGSPPIHSETLTASPNRRGSFSVVTRQEWCPRVVDIRATQKRSGDRARFTLRDFQCPW